MRLACRRPRRRVGLAQQGSEAQPPHGAALVLWLRRQLEAARFCAHKRMPSSASEAWKQEQRDGRDASDAQAGASDAALHVAEEHAARLVEKPE